MAQWLRLTTPIKFHLGPAVATGGLAAVTSLKASIVTALRIIRHGATVVVSVTGAGLTHVSGGHYYVSLTSVHTNTLGHLRLYVRASGTTKALPFWKDAHVVPQNVFDSLVSGTARLTVGTVSGKVTLAAVTHTGAIIPTVSTVTKLLGKVTLATITHTGAVIPTVSTVSKLLGKVTLATITHTGAIIPTVSTVSKLLGKVTLATITHTGAIIPTVSTVTKVLNAITVGTNNDKTGYTLASAAVVWTAGTRTLTSGSVMWTGTATELGAIPAASPTKSQGLMFLYMSSRNKRITTATGDKVHNSATSVIATAPISSTSITFTKSKYA